MDATLAERRETKTKTMRPLRPSLILAIVAFLSACGPEAPTQTWQPSDHRVPSAVEQAPDEAPVGTTGAALFAVHCASCHGPEGLGNGPGLPPMAPPVVSFATSAFQDSRTDGAIVDTVLHGRGGFMPAFASRLSPEGIRAVVEHLRTLRRE